MPSGLHRDPTRPIKDDALLLGGEVAAINETLDLIREDQIDDAQLLPVLQELKHFFLTDLMLHMKDEEAHFFPVVGQLPNGHWKIVRLQKEHNELRQAIDEFKTALRLDEVVGAPARQALLWNLVTSARAILSLLRSHADFEIDLTREIDQASQETPPPVG